MLTGHLGVVQHVVFRHTRWFGSNADAQWAHWGLQSCTVYCLKFILELEVPLKVALTLHPSSRPDAMGQLPFQFTILGKVLVL